MKHSIRNGLITGLVAACLMPAAIASAASPEGVSPGAVDRFATTRFDCPTFSWQAVAGTLYYEIVAYRLRDDVELAGNESIELSEAEEALYSQVPGGATGWTPELEQALEGGGRYVWFVRAVFDATDGVVLDASDWSQGRFFSVAAAPSAQEVEQALEVLQRYLGEGSGGIGLDRRSLEGGDGEVGVRRTEAAHSTAPPKSIERSVLTAPTAIKGSMPDAGGEVYGMVAVSSSPDGAGMAVANTTPGADLVQWVPGSRILECWVDGCCARHRPPLRVRWLVTV